MSTPNTRKRLSAGERRAAILDAAQEVFAERDYHTASIDDIARQAGISKALIYEHFDSKQQLHMSLVDRNARDLLERLAVATAGSDGARRLEAGLDAVLAFVEERRGAWRMLFQEQVEPETGALVDRILEQVSAAVAALIAEDPNARGLALQGAEREEAIAMSAEMLVGSVQRLASWWGDHPEVSRERMVEAVMEFAWLGLERLSKGERWTGA